MKHALAKFMKILPVACLLLVCAGCGTEDVTLATHTPVPTYPPVSVTLDQAKSRAPYNVLLPGYLPAGVSLVSVAQQDAAQLVDGKAERDTRLMYQGNSIEFSIEEVQAGTGSYEMHSLPVGRRAIATEVVDGFALAGERSGELATITAYIWNDVEGELVLNMVHQTNVLVTIDGNLSRDDIVKVAESLR